MTGVILIPYLGEQLPLTEVCMIWVASSKMMGVADRSNGTQITSTSVPFLCLTFTIAHSECLHPTFHPPPGTTPHISKAPQAKILKTINS
jgi:hypothetical protein